jgi:uncharacterized protein YecE (DUF72 family)
MSEYSDNNLEANSKHTEYLRNELTDLKRQIAKLARMTGNSWSVINTQMQLDALERFIREKQDLSLVS